MANNKELSYGSLGADVKQLQSSLKKAGYTLDVDGIFGSQTQAAVKDYQKHNNLTVDGIVGKNTWGALGNVPKTTTTKPVNPNSKQAGIGAGVVDKMKSATKAPNSTKPQSVSDDAISNIKDRLSTTKPTGTSGSFDAISGVVLDKGTGRGSFDAISGVVLGKGTGNAGYTESDAVKKASEMLQQQMGQKPGEYKSQWQAQLDDTMNKIMNREKFSYDMNADALYQQYKDQYTNMGRMAMMDTMGQASAMTGGYGNSYAQSAGQQAYQSHLQQLNDKIPELYQLALDKYQMEGDELRSQYGMMADREQQEYGRYRDSVSDWRSERDYLQNQYNAERDFDYGKFIDTRNFDYQQGRDKVADSQWQQGFDYQKDRDAVADSQWQQGFDYQKDRDAVADSQWQQGFDYQQSRDQVADSQWQTAFNYQQSRDKVTDSQWQKEFDEAVRQFNKSNSSSGKSGSSSSGKSGSSSSGKSGSSSSSSKNKDKPKEQPKPKKDTGYTTVKKDLDDIIAGSDENGKKVEKGDVSKVIHEAVKNGEITQNQAQQLLKTYTPRGYTY